MTRSSRTRATATLGAAMVLALAACSGGSGGTGTSGEEGGAEGPVTLTYWSWAPEIESIVEIWNEENPDIQVEVSTAAGFAEFTAKLLAAYEAGNPPDVNNTNYQNLPLLITSGVAADITEQMAPLREDFSPVAWDMVDFEGQVYGVPQATTPNLLIYRQDLLAELGIAAPTTWQEFADAARAVHAADPDSFLFNFDPASFGFFSAMGQQNGVSTWTLENNVWGVDINSQQGQEVAAYWGGLVEEGVVSTLQGGSPELNAAIADGRVLSVVDSVWAPISMAGYAPQTQGLWGAAPVPQWDPANPVSGVLGGSATMVSTLTEHPAEATEFAIWLNHSMASLEAFTAKVSIYPAMLEARTLPQLQTPPPLLENVTDFYQIAADVDAYSEPITWGPNVTTANEAYASAIGAAVQAGGGADRFTDALATIEETLLTDLGTRGFEVSED